jgi:hypothetical protein
MRPLDDLVAASWTDAASGGLWFAVLDMLGPEPPMQQPPAWTAYREEKAAQDRKRRAQASAQGKARAADPLFKAYLADKGWAREHRRAFWDAVYQYHYHPDSCWKHYQRAHGRDV